ncbi:MAG TPA: histone deacetylase [Sphingomonas sp.]|uniref:histone deacetylase family protein n=1 Tax=Sphingomonas sp. TaxID=28214 RepID=UPI002EDB85CE
MLHVVHHPAYVSPPPPGSPYAFDKYGLVMELLAERGDAHVVHEPQAMPRHWVEAVHAPAYVAEVIDCTVPRDKSRRIGFAVTGSVARRALLSPGGTWLAAKLALRLGHAANAAGGSHHALYDTGAGYCVFNDLVIAANRLLAERDAARILILDLDVHQGDGTAALTAGRPDIFTLSVHAAKNFPVRKAESTLDIALPDGVEDAAYLAVVAAHLPRVLDDFRPDLILYQGGVDPHRDDRLGRLALSDAGLDTRDRYVMRVARQRGIAVASTMGGGYGHDRLAVAGRHVASMLALADACARTEAACRDVSAADFRSSCP